MKNILYIGPYKENTGLGRSARRYIDALGYNLDINLSIRPIYFTKNLDHINESGKDYNEFEENCSKSYDMVIQHGYAHSFVYMYEFGENICIPEINTYNIGHTGWTDRVNMMDTVIVPSRWVENSLKQSGCETKMKMIPEPFDIKRYDNFESRPIFDGQNDSFVFYYIANYNEINNILALITAFYLEFEKHDDVSLVIKTNQLGQPDLQEAQNFIKYEIQKLQKALRVKDQNINKPHILIGNYREDYIMNLHSQADCYVNTCKCEGFGAASIESMLFDNLTIVNQASGPNTYINRDNGFEIKSILSNIYSTEYYFEYENTIYEMWREPLLNSIKQQMRKAYETDEYVKAQKLSKFNKNIFTADYFIEELLK
jgi:glycosyltransferase involved in cell wall biosynthesis